MITRRILREVPDCRVTILTTLDLDRDVYDALTSEATVKTHVAPISTKLDLRDRAQSAIVAYEAGLIEPERGQGPG